MPNQLQPLSVKILGIVNIVISLFMGLPMLLLAVLALAFALEPKPLEHGSTRGGTSGGIPYLNDIVDRAFGLVMGGVMMLIAGFALAVGLAIGIGLLRRQNWARVLGVVQGVCNLLVAFVCLILGLLVAREELVLGLVMGIVSSAPMGIFGTLTLAILKTNPWQPAASTTHGR